jgi:hypothetical protein
MRKRNAVGSINEGRLVTPKRTDGLSLTMTLLALPQPGKGRVTIKVNIDFTFLRFALVSSLHNNYLKEIE